MGIIHSTISFKDSGLAGIQACQRDWSGYLVHFTAAGKMVELKQYPQNNLSPSDLAEKLHNADKESFGIVKKIQKSNFYLSLKTNLSLYLFHPYYYKREKKKRISINNHCRQHVILVET